MCGYNPSRYEAFSPQHLQCKWQTRGWEWSWAPTTYICTATPLLYYSLALISSVHGLPLTTMQVLTDSAVRLNGWLNGCLLVSRQTQLLLLQLCRGHHLQPGGDGVPSTLAPFHFSSAPRITCSLPHLNHWKSSVQSCTLYHGNPITWITVQQSLLWYTSLVPRPGGAGNKA